MKEDYTPNSRIDFNGLDEIIKLKLAEFADLFKSENKGAFRVLSYVNEGAYDDLPIQTLNTIKMSVKAELRKAKICNQICVDYSDTNKSNLDYLGYALKSGKIIEGLDKRIKQKKRNNLLRCLLREN